MTDPGDQERGTRPAKPGPPPGQGDLFNVPAPPSGPVAKDPGESTRVAFWQFLTTGAGAVFWNRLEHKATEAFRAGKTRFSPRTFVAWYRDEYGLQINNDFSPWLADELVSRHPYLGKIIERRARTKAGPR
jgi:hypothetical protein